MTTFSPPTRSALHPTWCQAHLGTGETTTHISVDQVVETVSPCGRELGRVYVSLEQDDSNGLSAVRLSGASDTPMRPEQAIQVGQALIASAFAATDASMARDRMSR